MPGTAKSTTQTKPVDSTKTASSQNGTLLAEILNVVQQIPNTESFQEQTTGQSLKIAELADKLSLIVTSLTGLVSVVDGVNIATQQHSLQVDSKIVALAAAVESIVATLSNMEQKIDVITAANKSMAEKISTMEQKLTALETPSQQPANDATTIIAPIEHLITSQMTEVNAQLETMQLIMREQFAKKTATSQSKTLSKSLAIAPPANKKFFASIAMYFKHLIETNDLRDYNTPEVAKIIAESPARSKHIKAVNYIKTTDMFAALNEEFNQKKSNHGKEPDAEALQVEDCEESNLEK